MSKPDRKKPCGDRCAPVADPRRGEATECALEVRVSLRARQRGRGWVLAIPALILGAGAGFWVADLEALSQFVTALTRTGQG